MKSQKSITVVVPALNEEKNIEAAIETVRTSVTKYFDDIEILLFDDGSTDRTGAIADRLAAEDSRIRVIHHEKSKNLGGVYKSAIRMATKDLLIMIPGDNENPPDAIEPILKEAGEADIIVPYTANQEVRPFVRRVLSQGFVTLLNLGAGCRLRYYNGTVLHQVDLLRKIQIETDSFGYQAEALVKLLRMKQSFKEVPIRIAPAQAGRKSRALSIKNFVTVGKFLASISVAARTSH
jgi:dolichol-phosphate mannosyltransferase